MIDEYFERIARCRTLNELNAVHIGACNIMTPVETIALHRRMTAPGWKFPVKLVGPDVAEALGITLVNHMTMMVNDLGDAGKDRPEPFGRQRVANGVWRFSTGGERAAKTLLIGFTGNSDRLMMPSPTYLQHFDAAVVDIVFLVDRDKQGFLNGIQDVGDSLEAVIEALPALLGISEYRRLAVTGTSGGGLPAVLAGLRLKADAIMSIGCTNPDDERWAKMRDGTASQLLVQWAAESPETKVTLVVGAQSQRDHVSAEATLKLIRAQFIEVTDPKEPVKHNAAYPLVRQRKFAAFARQHLGLD